MGIHRVWAVSTAGLLLVLAFWDVKKHLLITIFPLHFVVLLGVASASIGATAWLGGEVVYRHGIGVLALPAPEMEGVGHDHEHGHEHMKVGIPTVVAPKQVEPPNKTGSQIDVTGVDGQQEHSGHDHPEHQ